MRNDDERKVYKQESRLPHKCEAMLANSSISIVISHSQGVHFSLESDLTPSL